MRFFVFVFVFALGACSTLEVHEDYEVGYDFSRIRTFAVVHRTKPNESDIVNERITRAIQRTLRQKGYKEAAKADADIVFLFHVDVTNKTDIYTDYRMVGYGRYATTVIATPRSYDYDEGKLVVDAFDPRRQKVVYRVVATDEIVDKKTPKRREEYIRKVIEKALRGFPPS